jgi:ubiquinol-cytochrome c reductase iron-sulfur subunit
MERRAGRLRHVALLLVAAVAVAILLPALIRAASPSRAAAAATASPSPLQTAFTPPPAGASASPTPAVGGSPAPGSGAAVYAANCSGCHGDHGQGLIGPSQAADAFPSLVAGMVRRGGIQMPAFPQLSPAAVDRVSAYVATQIAAPQAHEATVGEGQQLFHLYCSGCHSSTGRGGALSQGRNAPRLSDYPAAEAIAAMTLGRGNMPIFAGTTFDVRQTASVARFVETLESPASPGGWGLGYVGPVTEGFAAAGGLGLLVLLAVWLAWGKGQVKPALAGGEAGDGPAAPGWPAGLGLLVAVGGAVAFVVFFAVGNDTARIGATLALAFLGLGFALAYWGRDLSGDDVEVGRYPLPPEPAVAPDEADEPAALGDELARSAGVLTRRRFLTGVLASAAGIVGLSQLVLLGGLGPKSRGLYSTAWRPGRRLVTPDDQPIRSDALRGGGLIVAFPQGHTAAADSQVALVRLSGVTPLPGRETWSPQGFFAYSRVCTHAGCAVAQYEDEALVLLCPCHQSTFDLLRGCRPIHGPASRALPQLPLAIDTDGFLVAQRDFDEPIGPGFWNLYA